LEEFYPVLSAFGSVWITGHHSLKKFDGTTFTNWDIKNSSFPSSGMRIVDKDNLGNLWFIDYSNTLLLWKFDGSAFVSYAIPPQFDPSTVTTANEFKMIKSDMLNQIWLGGYGKLIKFDGTSFTGYSVPSFVVGGDPRFPFYGQTIPAMFWGMVQKSDSSKWFLDRNFSHKNRMTFQE
jgi:hypothetical protein